VHDSGLYATRLAARHGVSVPDLGLLTPLEFYRTAATHLPYAIPLHSKIFPRQDIITIFPRELTGAYGGANNGRIKPFVQRVKKDEILTRYSVYLKSQAGYVKKQILRIHPVKEIPVGFGFLELVEQEVHAVLGAHRVHDAT
jgi:hypothetical protein